MVIHCYILNTFWLNNVFSQSVPSGPIEPPKFNQGFISLNKDISRTVSQILKIRPHSRLQIKFSTTFILCKYTIFLLLRLLNSKKRHKDCKIWPSPLLLPAPPLSLSMYKIFQQRYLKNGRSDPSMNHLGTYVHTYKLMLQLFSFCPYSKI